MLWVASIFLPCTILLFFVECILSLVTHNLYSHLFLFILSVISEFRVEERIFGVCLTCHLDPLVHYMNLPTFIKLIPHSWIFRFFWVLVITNITVINIFIAKYLHVSIMISLDYIFRNKIIGDFYLFIIHVWRCHSSRFLLAFHWLQDKALTAWCGVKCFDI